MSQVTVIAKLKAKPGLEEKVRQELEVMVNETEKEPGCINYDLHRQMEEPEISLFEQIRQSKCQP